MISARYADALYALAGWCILGAGVILILHLGA
jgi:hypothetical protein